MKTGGAATIGSAGGAVRAGRSAAEAAEKARVEMAVPANRLRRDFLMLITIVQRVTSAAYSVSVHLAYGA